jgi:CRP/FNR family transcriptional regulator
MDAVVSQKVTEFFAKYETRSYRKGQILIHAHDNPTHILHLLEGRVKQYDISYRGDEVVLNVFKPPAFFPMAYAINETPNIYFFEAESDVRVQLADIAETVEFIKSNPDVLYNLLARVYRGTDGLLGRLAHMMAGSARSRILYEILIQGRRFGVERAGGIAIPANEGDIGSQAGLARETVNREINKLKRDGYITVDQNEIFIKDMNLLAESISREL